MHSLSVVTVDLETARLPSICLRQKSEELPLDVDVTLLRKLIEDMFATLYLSGGVGLAAPQVGVMWRLFIVDIKDRDEDFSPLVLINPKFTYMSDDIVEGTEGCLSIPGYISRKVPRSKAVKVEALNQYLKPVTIEAEDFLARVFQHEHDHLEGVLYLDKLRSLDDVETDERVVRSQTIKTIELLYGTEQVASYSRM